MDASTDVNGGIIMLVGLVYAVPFVPERLVLERRLGNSLFGMGDLDLIFLMGVSIPKVPMSWSWVGWEFTSSPYGIPWFVLFSLSIMAG